VVALDEAAERRDRHADALARGARVGEREREERVELGVEVVRRLAALGAQDGDGLVGAADVAQRAGELDHGLAAPVGRQPGVERGPVERDGLLGEPGRVPGAAGLVEGDGVALGELGDELSDGGAELVVGDLHGAGLVPDGGDPLLPRPCGGAVLGGVGRRRGLLGECCGHRPITSRRAAGSGIRPGVPRRERADLGLHLGRVENLEVRVQPGEVAGERRG
jgi:hypothetical protein